MRYVVTVEKRATYEIEADSEAQALNIADEWLHERDFDECEVEMPLTEEEDE